MKTRTRKPVREQEQELEESFLFEFDDDDVALDHLSDDELAELLFDEEAPESKGIFNLPTFAGLSMILVGVVYIFQKLGLLSTGLDFTAIVSMLPWLAGILIILLGFGLLSWGPKKKKKQKQKVKVKKTVEAKTVQGNKQRVVVEKVTTPKSPKMKARSNQERKRLIKSRDKKIAGVCAGIAEYFNLDPTLVRIFFVIGLFINGVSLPVYLLLSFIMPSPDPVSVEERITIIRDS